MFDPEQDAKDLLERLGISEKRRRAALEQYRGLMGEITEQVDSEQQHQQREENSLSDEELLMHLEKSGVPRDQCEDYLKQFRAGLEEIVHEFATSTKRGTSMAHQLSS